MSHLEKRGEELFVVVPNDAIAQLGWGHGDVLKIEVADGAVKVVRTNDGL
jgi:antitoxin component of MazEF toxin-antitoxin module